MKTIVADSSVLVKWVTSDNEQNLAEANKILEDVQNGKINVIAPELAKYEIGNALVKKGLTIGQAALSLGTIYASPVEFIPETEQLALKSYEMTNNVTYYDAAFMALAKQEKATLVTANPKHQKKVEGVKVVSLEDYR